MVIIGGGGIFTWRYVVGTFPVSDHIKFSPPLPPLNDPLHLLMVSRCSLSLERLYMRDVIFLSFCCFLFLKLTFEYVPRDISPPQAKG
jgi:hypothetical protein